MPPDEFIAAKLRAERGEEQPDPFLLRHMDAYPERWAEYGDVAKQAQRNWLKLLYPRNGLARESTQRKLAADVQQMAGEDPSPLEMLLAGRITALQIQVSVYEQRLAANQFTNLTLCEFLPESLVRAGGQLTDAVEHLLRVRKLIASTKQPVETSVAKNCKGTKTDSRQKLPTPRGAVGHNRINGMMTASTN